MQAVLEPSTSRRRSLRRALRVETGVSSNLWDGTAPFVATNVSDHGLWLDTDLTLDIGDELVVSLTPPRWQDSQPLTVLARVARVAFKRRKSEEQRSGMGLRFVDLQPDQASKLKTALEGLPPPLSRRRSRPVGRAALTQGVLARRSVDRVERAHPSIEEVVLPHVVLADGSRYTFRAEGALLTAGRPRMTPSLPEARIIPITSPMSAILARAS